MHQATKKLVELIVEGAKVYDLCVEGDKLIEQGTGAVYNKGGKGKVSKGTLFKIQNFVILLLSPKLLCRPRLSHLYFGQ